jgi:hypothetical protein
MEVGDSCQEAPGKVGLMVHFCNPSTQEAKAGASQV